MICAKCGATNPPASAFCGGCGSRLTPEFVAANQIGSPQSESPVLPPSGPVAQAAEEEMPTSPTIQPVAPAGDAADAANEGPTMRVAPAQSAPSASEFMPFPPAQDVSAENVQQFALAPMQAQTPPASPGSVPPQTPIPAGYPGSASPAQGSSSGAHPPLTPDAPAGMYPPPQTPIPGYPGGVYPPQTPVPGYPVQGQPSGVYPPQTPVPGYPPGAYPAQGPSGVYPPQAPAPGYPSGVYPPQSGVFPEQAGPAAWGMYAPAPTAPQAPGKLIRPLPRWAFIASIVVVTGVLAGLFFFTPPDWAAGGQVAGIVALVIGVLVLITFGVRIGLGLLSRTNPHRIAQVISALVLTVLLISLGCTGVFAQYAIHTVQAHALESQHNWQQAITEYQDIGQSAPYSEDIARVYNEWGETLLGAGQYANAITRFETVTNTYNMATIGYARAQKDAITAYLDWANQASQAQHYDQATKHYDTLLVEPYCNSPCQTQTGSADAVAYYNLAEQKLHQQPPDYEVAVAAFKQLDSRFSDSPDDKLAHADYAVALWGDGQQLLTSACTSALPLYQQLSSQFADTPQGQQAKSAMQKPEGVKGMFTSPIPSGAEAPRVALMKQVNANMTSNQFYAILANSPVIPVHSDGTFQFAPMKQGTYYLSWGTINQNTGNEIFYATQSYPANVGPLCTLDMGQINEAFPNP